MRALTISCAATFAALLLLASACTTDNEGAGQTTAVKQGATTSPEGAAPAAKGPKHAGCPHAQQGAAGAGHGDCACDGKGPHGQGRGDCACKGKGHEGCPHAQQGAAGATPGHGDCACDGKGPHGQGRGDCACKGKGHEGCPHAQQGAAGAGPGDCACKGKGPHGAGHGGCGCGGKMGHGMAGQLMHAALGLADLRPEQREAILALKRELHATKKSGAAREAHAALMQELAAQVKAGALDRARLQALADKMIAGKGEQKMAAKTAALNKLHGLLDAAQREKLVAGLELDKLAAPGPGYHAHGGKHRVFGHLLGELGLTEAQHKQIADKVHAGLGMKADMQALQAKALTTHKAVAEAFKGAKFDATKLPVLGEMHKLHGKRSHVLIELVAAALPLLNAEQKAKLASGIEGKALRRGNAPAGAPAAK